MFVKVAEPGAAMVRRAGDRERLDHRVGDGSEHPRNVVALGGRAHGRRLLLEAVQPEHHVEVRDDRVEREMPPGPLPRLHTVLAHRRRDHRADLDVRERPPGRGGGLGEDR